MRLRSIFFRRYHAFLKWLEHRYPPGFKGANLYTVLNILFKDLNNYDFTLRATAMAYSFFFALFPTLIFLFALAAYLPLADAQTLLQKNLQRVLPGEAFVLVEDTVNGIFRRRGFGLLSLTFVFVVFVASRGVRTMLQAFSKSVPDRFKRLKTWRLYTRALKLFFYFSALLILMLGVIVAGQLVFARAARWIDFGGPIGMFVVKTLQTVFAFVIITLGVSFLYYISPTEKRAWRFFSPGSFLTSLLLLLAQYGLQYYFSNFGSYNRLFGSLTAVMILMLWFYYISVVLLVGFELNAAIEKAVKKLAARAAAQAALAARANRPPPTASA